MQLNRGHQDVENAIEKSDTDIQVKAGSEGASALSETADPVVDMVQVDSQVSPSIINKPIEASPGKLKEALKFETCEEQEARIRAASKFGHLHTWRLLRIIIKSGDDLRSE